MPGDSQSYTRPSVSLVELSRRKTQISQSASTTSPQVIPPWVHQGKIWRIIGYALLIIVFLAGAAGLYLIWLQLR